MSEYGYIPEAPDQSFGNNKGIFTPNDIYDLTRADKYTQYGQLDLLQTQNANTNQNIEFTNYEGYNVHLLVVNNHIFPAGNQNYGIRFYESGVLERGTVYQEASNEGGLDINGSYYPLQYFLNDCKVYQYLLF